MFDLKGEIPQNILNLMMSVISAEETDVLVNTLNELKTQHLA
jgi:hypothetical protein